SGSVTLNLDTSKVWLVGGNGGLSNATALLGTTDSVTMTLQVSATTALRAVPTTGTPNLLGGVGRNNIGVGGGGGAVGGGGTTGAVNQVLASYGVVGGGAGNTASNQYATVGGGLTNAASGSYATLSGGQSNSASGTGAAIGGGQSNIASNASATVGG